MSYFKFRHHVANWDPISFPIWLPQRCSRWTKKRRADKKVYHTNVLIPWYPISYLTIASSVFFGGGRLRVPTRRCDLVVPADWGWVQQMNQVANRFMNQPNEWIWMLCFQTTFHKSTMLCSLITATSGSAWYWWRDQLPNCCFWQFPTKTNQSWI